jgi:hypothetical protein
MMNTFQLSARVLQVDGRKLQPVSGVSLQFRGFG